MYYAQQDIELNKKRKKKEYLTTLGLMLPFLAICAAGFAVRNQWARRTFFSFGAWQGLTKGLSLCQPYTTWKVRKSR